MPACACTYVRTRTREGVQTRHAPKPSPWVFRVFCPGLPGFFGFSAAAGRPGSGFCPAGPVFYGSFRGRGTGFRAFRPDPGLGSGLSSRPAPTLVPARTQDAPPRPGTPGFPRLPPRHTRFPRLPPRSPRVFPVRPEKQPGLLPRPGPGCASGPPAAAVRRVRRGFRTLPRESRPCSPQGGSNPHGSPSGDRRPLSRGIPTNWAPGGFGPPGVSKNEKAVRIGRQ